MGPGAVSHPHRDGERLLQVGADYAVGDLDGLGAVELKHLVAVVAVVGGQSDRPVGGAAGRGQKLHGAGAGPCGNEGKAGGGGVSRVYQRRVLIPAMRWMR